MSRLQDLCLRVLTHCGVDPTAGDLSAHVAPWPPSPTESTPYSPYTCEPTRWGDEDVSVVSPETNPDSAVSEDSCAAQRPARSRARRRKLEVDRQPVPRGLLVS